MLTLNIQAPDTEALWAQLRGILQGEAAKPAAAGAPNLPDAVAGLPKQTRKQKAAMEAAVEKPAMIPVEGPVKEPTVEAPKPATLDDLRAALMALSKAKGEQIVWELMKDFDVQKASAVPAEQRAEVIALANKWAAQQ